MVREVKLLVGCVQFYRSLTVAGVGVKGVRDALCGVSCEVVRCCASCLVDNQGRIRCEVQA